VKLNSARQRASPTLIKQLHIKWQIKAVIRTVIALCHFGEIDGAALQLAIFYFERFMTQTQCEYFESSS